VVGLVLHCGCEYLLLGVDVVCHCFCSPCCDLCAAAWVTVLCAVFVGEKGKGKDTLEKFYIYRETKNRNQINDRLTVQSNLIFRTIVNRRAAHIKRSRDTKKRHPQRQYTGQLSKRPHRGHNTVNKNSGKQRQHPRKDNHIHSVGQDQPQGMKNRGQNNEIHISLTNKLTNRITNPQSYLIR